MEIRRVPVRNTSKIRTFVPLYTADALVLRTYKLGEADRIVVFLTRDRGKKRGVAKGARRHRSRFVGALEPLTEVRVAYFERERRELVGLNYAETVRSPLAMVSPTRAGLHERVSGAGRHEDDGGALGYVGYFAELLDEWAQEADADDRLYRLGASMLDALAAGAPVEPLARYFEYWLLRLEGVYPAIDTCPRCGERVLSAGAVLVPADRSYVCGRCAHGGPRLSADAMTFLRGLGRVTPSEAARTSVPVAALREIEDVHHRLIAMHLEKQLRSARIVKELGPDL